MEKIINFTRSWFQYLFNYDFTLNESNNHNNKKNPENYEPDFKNIMNNSEFVYW